MANFVRSGSLGSDLKGLTFTGETVEVDRADEEWVVQWSCPDCNTVFATPYWARQGETRTHVPRVHMRDYLARLMDAQHRAQTACLGQRRLLIDRPGRKTGRWMDGKGRIHAAS